MIDGASAWTYTAAMQVADFGAVQPALPVRVAQFSGRVGFGHAADGVL